MQSTYENLVEFNLSESGVRPLTARELVGDPAGLEGLLDQPLVYSQSNGTIELRQAIAAMYPGAGVDHIEVTNGGSEANFITTFNLIEPGDDVVMLVPNYMQTWGLSRAFGGTIREWRLVEDRDGRALAHRPRRARAPGLAAHEDDRHLQSEQPDRRPADRGRSRRASRGSPTVTARGSCRTRSIAAPRSTASKRRRCGAARRGRSSRAGCRRPTACPGCASAGSSAPPSLIASLWSYHDYVTIAPGALSDRLARVALQPERRAQLFERTRGILRRNLPLIEAWLTEAGGFQWITPEAGAIVYVRYDHPINSTTLVTPLARREERADRAGRSLRHGRLPAPRLRRAARVQPRRPRSAARSAGDAVRQASQAAVHRLA